MPGAGARRHPVPAQTRYGGPEPSGPILPAMRRLIALAVLATLLGSCGGTTRTGPDRPVRILAGEPTTLDPAA